MKNFIIYYALLVCFFATKMSAQKTFEQQAKEIANNIGKVTKEEKALLKTKVEAVNVQLEKGEITKEQADKQKMDLATATSLAIEEKVSKEQEKLNALVQEKVNGNIQVNKDNKFGISINVNKNDSINKKNQGERRSTSQFVFALGLNNVVTNSSLDRSDFRTWGSRFYEWGITRNYRLLKNDNLLHLKYGFSVMYNNLSPTNDRIFTVSGNQTNLAANATPISDSRFKNVHLVLPLHLEFDFSKDRTSEGKPYFKSHEGVRLGIGGYVGTNLRSKQYLESNVDGYETEAITKGDFNTSNFIYGASAYVGYKETSLYVKYDLNPLFRDNVIKQNNVSLGVRFDFN